jgi:hypothetical protein
MKPPLKSLSLALVLSLTAACGGGVPKADGGTGGGAGGTGGGTAGPFTITTLDPDAKEATYFAVAVNPTTQRVGVAYYTPRGTATATVLLDGGAQDLPDYNLKYLEWNAGVTTAPETVRFVQRKAGLALQFDPAGNPTMAYLGGDTAFVPGQSIFWFQNDAVTRTKTGGSWGAEVTVAKTGADITCGNPVSDRGLLVGLWPALAFDSTGKEYFAWRDGHDGQFPQQDWNGSDVELMSGAEGSLTTGTCVKAGGNDKQAWGGHIQMVIGAGDQPAMVYDQIFLTADGAGSNADFQMRNTDGTWTTVQEVMPISSGQTGPALAWDAVEGYGIAAYDALTGVLNYINATTGKNWQTPDPVVGAGSSGWYPGLTMDTTHHEPVIAYYHCSDRAAATATDCDDNVDELRVTQRIEGNWQTLSVDPEGGWNPKVGFFDNGKRWLVYRHPHTGVLKLAVEN